MTVVQEKFFSYDNDKSYSCNFSEWYAMNCIERDANGDKSYSKEEAEIVFNSVVKNIIAILVHS